MKIENSLFKSYLLIQSGAAQSVVHRPAVVCEHLPIWKEVSTEIASNHLETFELIDTALTSDYIKYFSSNLSLLYSAKVSEKKSDSLRNTDVEHMFRTRT